MNLLQEQLNNYIFNWQPGYPINFIIESYHVAGDILEVAKNNEFVVGVDSKYHEQLEMWFELDEGLLSHQFKQQQEENKLNLHDDR